MEFIYRILDNLLPFSWIQYDFMKNALIAILVITPLFGILGTLIVNNKLAFFSEALGHSALTGIAIGVVFGIADTNVSMLAFAVVFALGLNYIRKRKTVSTDTVISVFSSFSSAVGLMILSRGGNFSKYAGLLVGDILSITDKEIKSLFFVFAVTIAFWLVAFNKLHAISVNESLARSKNIPVDLIDNMFVIVLALIVMFSIKWVGILIINALLILPAATSRNLAKDMREYHLFSVMFSLFSGVLGLILSYYANTATGPTIVIISSLLFFLTLPFGNKGK